MKHQQHSTEGCNMTTRADKLQDNLCIETVYHKTTYEMVREFTKAMGQPLDTDIHVEQDMYNLGEPSEIMSLRYRLIEEEVDEFMTSDNYENMLKELMDIKYVIDGFCATFGWDADEAFYRVHESNMSKLGDDGKPVYRADGKVTKGPNYKPCDLSDLV
jgi:predicted house-cleaning noncanonical NTP pyrophosphatase (MazG superfamily)